MSSPSTFNRRSVILSGLFLPLLTTQRTPVPPASPAANQFQRWLESSRSAAGPVIFEAATSPVRIDGPVHVPDGMQLVIRSDLSGTPNAQLIIGGASSVLFENGATCINVPITIVDGSVSISGFRYTGSYHLAAIRIPGPGPYRNVKIDDIDVRDANYGILRSGADSQMAGGVISNSSFSNLAGDAVEWNICPNDSDILVTNLDISGIDNTGGKPNWGIGVGFAGRAYDRNWSPELYVKQFTIRNIKGRSLRQLIHVEAGRNFTIENITGNDISDRYSKNSGLETASVACYGCSDFTVDGVIADSGIILFAGAIRGQFINPSRNVTVQNIQLSRGNLSAMLGGSNSYAHFSNVKLSAGSLELKGAAAQTSLTDIAVTSANGAPPFIDTPDFLSGNMRQFRPARSDIRRKNVRFDYGR